MEKEKAPFAEMVDAWWKTADIMEALPDKCTEDRARWHAYTFGTILKQCGWTTSEWNVAIAKENKNQEPLTKEEKND